MKGLDDINNGRFEDGDKPSFNAYFHYVYNSF